MKEKLYYVYELIDPRNNQIFYIGKGYNNRMYYHFNTVKYNKKLHNKHLYNKLIQLITENLQPIYKKIFETYNEGDAYDFERQRISEIGLENLCNVIPGGNGWLNGDIEKARQNTKNLWDNVEYRNKVIYAQKNGGAKKCWESRRLNNTDHHTEETKKIISEKSRLAQQSVGFRKGKHLTQEQKQKVSIGMKKFYKENPEARIIHRQKILGKKSSEETKKKISNGQIVYFTKNGHGPSKGIKHKHKRNYTKNGYKMFIQKCRENNINRFKDENFRKKFIEIQKNRKKVQCKYCKGFFDPCTINRWHNENCKVKNGK
jgi:hypothetical protein